MAHPSSHLRAHDAPVPPAPITRPSTARSLLLSLRPEQWTKNFVVFAALLFGQKLDEPRAVALAAAAFLVFCALSGAVYLVNDVLDREADRKHPTKSRRPIASGALAPGAAIAWTVVLSLGGLLASWYIGRSFFFTALGYLVLLTLYSGTFKGVVILDVLTIAIGFVLRAVAGANAIQVPISHWLLVCTILLALFLALAKRRQELLLLADGAKSHRRILQEYSPYLLDQMISVVGAATIMGYALYTVSQETIEKFGSDHLLWTLPFPIYGLFRYLYLVHQKQGGGSPAEMLVHDRPLLACVLLWAVSVALIVYGPSTLAR